MRNTTRTAAALALVLVAVLVLAACGGSGDDAAEGSASAVAGTELPASEQPKADPVALEAFATAGQAFSSVTSAHMEIVVAVESPDFPAPVQITMTGAFDTQASTGRFDLDLGNILDTLGPGQAEAAAMVPDVILFDEEALYIRFPDIRSLMPEAKKWVRMDMAELAQSQGLDPGAASSSTTVDPAQLADMLEAIGAGVEVIGQEQVRGVETTRYSATIDFERLGALVPPEQQLLFQAQLAQITAAGLDEIPIDVWIDAEGLVRRIGSELRIPSAIDPSAPGGTVRFTLELFDFGAPVEVQPPKKRNTMPFEELLGGSPLFALSA